MLKGFQASAFQNTAFQVQQVIIATDQIYRASTSGGPIHATRQTGGPLYATRPTGGPIITGRSRP
jgi:hypothetical protein